MTTIDELQQAMQEFEEREKVDLLVVCLFSDGSGHVMVPELTPAGQRDTAETCTGEEQVFEFQNTDQLGEYLRAGNLPENEHEAAAQQA